MTNAEDPLPAEPDPDVLPAAQAAERELRLRLATDALGLGVFELVDGVPIWENDCIYRIFGRERSQGPIPPDEFMTRVVHPEDALPLTSAFEQAIAEGRTLTVPCRIRRERDGAWRRIEFTSYPQRREDGHVRVVGVVADVTEREESNRLLRESEERYRALYDAMPAGVLLIGEGGRLRAFNDVAHQMLGWQRDEMSALALQDLVEPSCWQALSAHLAQALAGQGAFRCECRCRHRDGGLLDVLVSARRVQVDGALLVQAILLDLTAQKEAERALLLHKARLDVALEAGRMGAWEWDVGSRTARWSDGLYTLTGLPRGDGVEQVERFLNLVPEEDRLLVEQNMAGFIEPGVFPEVEHRIVRPDGQVRWIQANGRCLRDAGGRVTTVVGVDADITERKLLEIDLREADRRKDEFLAILSHELRNPLAPIASSVAALRRGVPPSKVEQLHEIIERQSLHLSRLVDDLLEASRLNTGRIVIQPTVMAMDEAVRTALEAVQPELTRRGQQVRWRHEGEPLPLWADLTRVVQVMANLLNNASKFSDDGAQVDLQVQERPNDVVVSVQDNGCGIEPEALPHVFDLFMQASAGRERTRSGLGIGLALVHRVVELHGGRAQVCSRGPGQGTVFTVTLPRHLAQCEAAQAGHLAPARTDAAPAGLRRLLIVDDNRDAADSLALLMEDEGRAVEVAYSPAAALDAVTRQPPDAALLDLGMPGMDGWALAAVLRERAPGVRLIALSGHVSPADRARAREVGFVAHLPKPAPLDELRRLLDDRAA